ncbi:MAG: NAD(P)H-hydrate dehydratase [Eubacteriales bacterium]
MSEPKKLSDGFVKSVLKKRAADSNKGSYGTLNCVCGSVRYPGAAGLCVEGALRSGAGIVRLMSIRPVIAAVSSYVREAVYEPLSENAELGISKENIDIILTKSSKSTALVCGCGLGCTSDIYEIVSALIENYQGQLILDADALNSISVFSCAKKLSEAKKPVLITPHIGEMSRLCGDEIHKIKEDRTGCALRFASDYECIVILKDYITHIASPDGEIYVSSAGNAGLARGGSGDILAGMAASFCAQGYSPFDAACCAVHLHGRAADLCALRLSQYGMLPHDIFDDLCLIFKNLGF